MTGFAIKKNEVPLETSIPDGGVTLESILCTEELQRRPTRPPDHKKENCALVALVSALADSPRTILQTMAETILEITQSDSAGLSVLTKDDGKRFYWPAIAGVWSPHVGGGTPRNFGPCGDVLDRNCTLLFRHFERRYPYLLPVIPAAEECLLVPFYVGGKAVGTIWAIMHSDRRKFDAEDERVMASLGKFASSTYQALESIHDLKFQVAEREKAERELRGLNDGLEKQVRVRTEELEQRSKQAEEREARIRRLVDANIIGIFIWNLDGKIIEANEAFLRMLGYKREDLVSGRMRWTDLTPAEWQQRDARAIAELKHTGTVQPYEKEFFRKDCSRVPVLAGGALFEGDGSDGVAFVLDLSEQKRSEEEWQPETFASAQEFLDHLREFAPSCLMLDISLPGLNGIELQKRVAVERTDMPIFFITGHGDVPMSVGAKKAGAVEFLTKPFNDEVLWTATRQAPERSCLALAQEVQELRDRYASLTPRERDVMKLVVSGLLNKQVAGELEITESTLKAHRGQVMQEDEGQLGSRFGGNDCETPSECCPKPFNEFWVVKV